MRKINLLLIVSLFLATLSCKKDEEPTKKIYYVAKTGFLQLRRFLLLLILMEY